jgi:hypothetical protein
VQEDASEHAVADDGSEVAFPFDEGLNRRLHVWEGAAWKLQVDALVINTNEALADRSGFNRDVFERGGSEVRGRG